MRRGRDDARPREAHVEGRGGEGREQAEGEEEVADAAGASCGKGVLDDVARGAEAGDAPGYEARVVGQGRTCVGDLDGGAIGYGFEEAEEGDLVWGEAEGGG